MKKIIKTKGGLPNCARCQASTRAVAPAAAEFSTNSVRIFSHTDCQKEQSSVKAALSISGLLENIRTQE